jgi:NAD(P)-dependent dehydrogenase (short-subunit alcohol dehydrogenase family)
MSNPAAYGNLCDKVIVVTGAGRGLGAALCETLAAAGAQLIAADIQHAPIAALCDRLSSAGWRATSCTADVGRREDAERLIRETLADFGAIDVLINNAGINVALPLNELAIEDWDRVLQTNLRGPFLLSKLIAAHMLERGSGHILNIASTAAKRAGPDDCAYYASEWGLLGLSHALHAELRAHGIRVSAVIPGGIHTPALIERDPDIDISTLQEPADVAGAIAAVLCMPASVVVPEIMLLPMQETSWP